MAVTISGLTWAKRHKRDFDAVISIEDPLTRRGLRFHRLPHPAHLTLQFVDLDTPVPPPFDTELSYRMASREQIEEALAFGLVHKHVLIHCQVGIARSPAVALGILMQQLGSEEEAYAVLQQIRPQAVPNRHVIRLVDEVLGSKLFERLDAWYARNKWSLLRRLLCRRSYFLDGGVPLALEPELKKISPLRLTERER